MTKYQYTGPATDYPTLGFSVTGTGSIVDGTLSTPELTSPPDTRWAVYTGADPETGVTRYGTLTAVTPQAEPTDGYILRYSDSGNAYVPTSPADFTAITQVDAAIDSAVASELTATLDSRTAALLDSTTSATRSAAAVEKTNTVSVDGAVTLPDVATATRHVLNMVGTRVDTPTGVATSTATTGGSLSPGTFSYRVSAINAAGETLASAAVSRTIAGSLAEPTLNAPTTATTGGTLAPGTYYYRLTATNSIGETTGSAEVSQVIAAALATPVNAAFTTATTGGTLAAATYSYRVSATNAVGETLASTATTITTTGTTSTVTVNWGAVTGATGYKVYGRVGGSELLIASVGDVTTYTDDGSIAPAGALPTGNTTATSTNTVGLTWTAIAGATGYKVYRSTTTGGTTTSPALVASVGAVTSYTDTGAATTAGAVPATNTTSTTTNTITVTWDAAPRATAYRVYGRTGTLERIVEQTGTSYVDTGAVTPAGALPTANTTVAAAPVTLPAAVAGKSITILVKQDAVGDRPATFAAASGDTVADPGALPVTASSSAEVTFRSFVTGTWVGHMPLTTSALSATFAPKWKASTAYAAGAVVLAPDGGTVKALAAFTSGTTYNAADWTTADGVAAAVDKRVAPIQIIRRSTWASIGDSISARATVGANGSGGLDIDRRSWQHWTNISLGQRFDPIVNYAVSGKTAEEMVTEQLPQVLAMSPTPGYCTLLGGTNSINGGATDVTVIASLKKMIDDLIAARIRPIVGTITPRTGFTATQSTYLVKVNAWIRDYCPQVGAILVDWFGDLSDSAGAPAANVHGDGLHPTVVGAVRMARRAATALSPVIPAVNRLPTSNLESPDPNRLTNPMMTGITGTKFDAGALGDIATNWTLRSIDGTTYSATGSKIARTDVPGDWQKIVIASGTGIQFYQGITDTTRVAVGDKVYALFEFEADSDLAGATSLGAYLTALGGTGGQTSNGPKKVGNDAYTGAIAAPASGVIRTPTLTVHTGMTELRVAINVVGGTGTLRVGRCAVYKTA